MIDDKKIKAEARAMNVPELQAKCRTLWETAHNKFSGIDFLILRCATEINRARESHNIEYEMKKRVELRDLRSQQAAQGDLWRQYHILKSELDARTDPTSPRYGQNYDGISEEARHEFNA